MRRYLTRNKGNALGSSSEMLFYTYSTVKIKVWIYSTTVGCQKPWTFIQCWGECKQVQLFWIITWILQIQFGDVHTLWASSTLLVTFQSSPPLKNVCKDVPCHATWPSEWVEGTLVFFHRDEMNWLNVTYS